MDKDQNSMRIRYEYEQEDNLTLKYAHGVWGGVNPQGEIELNFYTESDKLPLFSERILSPDGSMGHEIIPYDEHLKVVTRNVHSKLILSYHTARAVLEWLAEKVDTLEEGQDGPVSFFDDDGMAQ